MDSLEGIMSKINITWAKSFMLDIELYGKGQLPNEMLEKTSHFHRGRLMLTG